MLEPGAVVEHRQGPTARWLRDRRVSIAIGIAIAEGVLIIAGGLSKALALVVAIAVVVLYFTLADRLRPGAAKEFAWIAAVSQALVMLVPVLVILVGTLALIGVAALAVVALVLLLSRRG
jgi:hypothetical protein